MVSGAIASTVEMTTMRVYDAGVEAMSARSTSATLRFRNVRVVVMVGELMTDPLGPSHRATRATVER